MSTECTICRKRLLPSALKVLSQNKHRDYPQQIFEIGDTVIPDAAKETGVNVVKMLSCAISSSAAGYEDISAFLDAFMRSLGMEYTLKASRHPSFIEGRMAEVIIKNKPVGIVGELHPQVLENWKLEMPVAAFELNLEKIFGML